MQNRKLRLMSILCTIVIGTSTNANINAITGDGVLAGAIGSTIVSCIPNVLSNIWNFVTGTCEDFISSYKISKNQGFVEPKKSIENIELILSDKSNIRVYGHEKVKSDLTEILSGIVARIDNIKRGKVDKKELRGNIIYMLGPSGVGKTKMCYAIADALLKHPEKTCFFCHSESITAEAELGVQLFKTISSKDIGKKRAKNIFGNDGLMPKDEESPLLKHVLDWYESVVIIDEFDKMKLKSATPGSTMNIPGVGIVPVGTQTGEPKVDNSADEILRSISSTGKYKFMNKEVDCSKVLFLITTNETLKELESNFGINGKQGGGVQRLNVVTFDYLTMDACRGIVEDLTKDVTLNLTDPDGPFGLDNIEFSKETVELMAQYIFDDKILQGRAKNKLEDKIYCLFSRDMGKETGKTFEVAFFNNNGDVHFTKSEM